MKLCIHSGTASRPYYVGLSGRSPAAHNTCLNGVRMDENGTMASHRAVRTFQLVDIDCNMSFGSTCAAYRIQCMPPSSWIVSRRTRTWPCSNGDTSQSCSTSVDERCNPLCVPAPPTSSRQHRHSKSLLLCARCGGTQLRERMTKSQDRSKFPRFVYLACCLASIVALCASLSWTCQRTSERRDACSVGSLE